MITFESVTIRYDGQPDPVLADVDLHIPDGELCLVVGRTGSGKSTLLRAVNGLVPHFTGGHLSGRVIVAGRDTRDHPPRELADIVGYVGQDPLSGFVTDVVEEELAYGMESLGLAPQVMRRRVEETLDVLGMAELRDAPLLSLSAGQQQRVAIGSVLTIHPRVLVLDEPTSALDPGAAEDVLALLQRLVHDLGTTVLLAEHRLERVVQYADRIVLVPGHGAPIIFGEPRDVLATASVAPPVVELGRLAGWNPLPLSVREARREAGPLRSKLAGLTPTASPAASAIRSGVVVQTRDLRVRRGQVPVLRGIDMTLREGEVVALMGRNGAGKTTLLNSLVGMLSPTSGSVDVGGDAPDRLRPRELVRRVGFVPQEAGDLLYAETVQRECAQADKDTEAVRGTAAALLADLVPGIAQDTHPRDLSEGQRLALALAVVLAGDPPLLLLDEPTRGLDYAAKAALINVLRKLAAQGRAILLATHDVELAAALADRTMILAEGEVVSEGPTSEVVTSSPAFAPQVAKVLAPAAWLTVADVAQALSEAG